MKFCIQVVEHKHHTNEMKKKTVAISSDVSEILESLRKE